MALSHPTIILLSAPISFVFLPSSTLKPWKMHLKTLKIHCSAASSNGEVHDWRKWVPKKLNFGPDKVLQSIAGATSSPICQYISSPPTVLHSVDPRIKLVTSYSLYLICGYFCYSQLY